MSAHNVNSFSNSGNNVPAEVRKTQYDMEEAEQESCYHDLCVKKNACGGYLTWGYFKDRNHFMYCTLFTVMVIAFLVAIIIPLIINSMIDQGINDTIVVDSTSASAYNDWHTNIRGDGYDDVKIQFIVRLFDVQNPKEIINGAKPIVLERGPYAYDEYYEKFDISWADDGDQVTYNTWKYYSYNQENSGAGCSEFDNITLPYTTVIGFQYLLSTLPPETQMAFDYALDMKLEEEKKKAEQAINYLAYEVSINPNLTRIEKAALENKLTDTNNTVKALITGLEQFFAVNDAGTVLFKLLLCNSEFGISPFWVTQPSLGWFGWLKDPILSQVQLLLLKLQASKGIVVPWTTAVPGITNNYTSIDDARRRKSPDTQHTGKKHVNKVAQYIRYQNMSSMWSCLHSASKYTAPYIEGKEYPACPHFQNEWTDAEATEHGYGQPFATPYANRVEGTDATMFGRPIVTEKLQVFISDIYRSAYLEHTGYEHVLGIRTKKYILQNKDLQNSTTNPENAQYYQNTYRGLENATKATGVPLYVSYPHFYEGDDRLVSAVEGLQPNADSHSTYLLLEPETGLLTKVKKRLQISYLMNSYSLPETNPALVPYAFAACENLTETIATISQLPGVNASNLPNITCGLDILAPMLTCLSQPSKWNFQNGGVYFPYGWASEDTQITQDTADYFTNEIYGAKDLADQTRFWGLVIACSCFATMCILAVYEYNDYYQRKQRGFHKDWEDYRYKTVNTGAGSTHGNKNGTDPLGFAINPVTTDIDTTQYGESLLK